MEISYSVYGISDLNCFTSLDNYELILLNYVLIADNHFLVTYEKLYNIIKCDILKQIADSKNHKCRFLLIKIHLTTKIGNDVGNIIIYNPNKLKFDIDVTKSFYLHKLIENVI